MKNQFLPIFRHEFITTAKSKPFIFTTLLFALAFFVGLGFPDFIGRSDSPKSAGGDVNSFFEGIVLVDFGSKKLLISARDAKDVDAQSLADYLKEDLGFEEASVFQGAAQELEDSVLAGTADYALYFTSPLEYTLYMSQVGVTDISPYQIDEAVLAKYRTDGLKKLGATDEQAQAFLTAQTTMKLVATKSDGNDSAGYTYILIALLFITIMIYGGIVASSVVTEKSSRAMELLITAAKPGALMFGKVLGVGGAGLCQLCLWVLAAFGGYRASGEYWKETSAISSLFEGGNTRLLAYTIIFFVLGYLLYSFLFGAVGSLVSRTEDLQGTMMPLSLLLIVLFYVSYFSIIFNYTNSTLIKVMSFVPFTSPLAMFIRIVNNLASPWEIALSLVLLVAGIIAVGALAAAIYRVGVLLYGKPPKIRELVKLVRRR
ncbi:MAG: ABC transporter permease [Oscillospiraceae bacterium]|jgi:ABC-2 type transport system permease protein|nr:ABC transporter permease [Oscillospiraceae bacterium]